MADLVRRTRRKQAHSAYWYAKKYGWTYSEKTTYTGRYLDYLTLCGRGGGMYNAVNGLGDWAFNPLMFGTYVAMDLGVWMREGMRKLSDPAEREKLKGMIHQNLRKVQRPLYYARERERRRELRRERRKIRRRSTTAPMPTPADIRDAWNTRKGSKANMIRLGGLLHDLECYVDNSLVFDGNGRIVKRRGGIRGWLNENLPELLPHYKALMSYKAMAVKLRQATQTRDPRPTARLLEQPHPKVVAEIFAQPEETFAAVLRVLDDFLSPDRVFMEERRSRSRRVKRE